MYLPKQDFLEKYEVGRWLCHNLSTFVIAFIFILLHNQERRMTKTALSYVGHVAKEEGETENDAMII